MDKMKQVLGEVGIAIGPEVIKQLARAETAERVLRQFIPHQRAITISVGNFLFGIGTVLISRALLKMRPGKSDIPQILQPKIQEIKEYLKKLEDINNEIDRVMNQIEEMIERRNYRLTEEEKFKVEMLLMAVETKSQQLKNYFEEVDKSLESLHSEVIFYKNKKNVSGWKVFLSITAGAGAGALGAAFFPVLAPAAAVYGGGVIGGVGRFFYEKEANDGEYAMVDFEIKELQCRLNKLKTGLRHKELDIDKVKDILGR